VGELVAGGHLKDALEKIFAFIRKANKYFDTRAPWITRTEDPNDCQNTLFTCVQVIANLSVLLNPFLPFSSEKIQNWLQIGNIWEFIRIASGFVLPQTEILFEKLEP